MKRKAGHEDLNSCTKIRKMAYSQMDSSFCGASMYPASHSYADADLRKVVENFVNLYENLDTCNDVNRKPSYSYTELVYLALMRSPNFCLPITEIYRYIESRFLFFKNSTREHWKNAARHSLSKTKCFTKIAVGRGSCNNGNLSRSTYLWCIVPQSIPSFARGDYRATLDKDIGNSNALRCGFYRANASHFWEQIGHYISRKMDVFRQLLSTSPDPGSIFQVQICRLSTDQSPQTLTPTPMSMLMPLYHPLTNQQPSYSGGSYDDPKESIFQPLKGPTTRGYANKTASATSTSTSCMHYEMPSSTSGAEYVKKPENTNDPWLSTTISSPTTSFSSIESDRRTPPLIRELARDSGNETLSSESSPEEYYKSLPSCRMQVNKNSRASTPLCTGKLRGEKDFNFVAIQDQNQVFMNQQETTSINYPLFPNAACDSVTNISTVYDFHGNNGSLPEVYPQYELTPETLSVYTAAEYPYSNHVSEQEADENPNTASILSWNE
ncbi:hypothetical protein ACJMK2_004309 [Sinanodonta woodiana]|uniref:Fork-head domain-containing protein n=1 Tax=Sinanodonta woodiana TaxID=1069815 RepID=A0ABD3Y0V5_SINWO